MHPTFSKLVGQDALKRRLSFYLEGYAMTQFSPFLLFKGPKGSGKTNFARRYAAALKKPTVEINCATIKNAKQFFEQIFMAVILNADVTILFDECHKIPLDLQEEFLTILNTEKSKRIRFERDGQSYFFDFTKLTFLFATTEYHALLKPLVTRLTPVDFVPYTHAELAKILAKHTDWVIFEDNVQEEIATTLRDNPRITVLLAADIQQECNRQNKKTFGAADWVTLCHKLDIKKYGLSNGEITVLKILAEQGSCSLNMLAALTGESRSAVQQELEFHLLKLGLMKIEGQRHITPAGRKLVKDL